MEKTRLEILKEFAEYDRNKEYGAEDKFVLGGTVPKILEKYNYSEYLKNSDNSTDDTSDNSKDDLVFRLLDFVCDHFGHDGQNGNGTGNKITDLIKFCEKNNHKTNCRGLSMLLASLLRLNRIKAQHITCMPNEEPFNDCHVVVDCLLPSGKRVMLDPTHRLYLKDKKGEYVSIPHFREMILNDEPFFENETAGYNGGGFNNEDYKTYMTKNLFRFARCTLNKNGIDGNSFETKYIELVPENFPLENLQNAEKRIFLRNDIEFWKM